MFDWSHCTVMIKLPSQGSKTNYPWSQTHLRLLFYIGNSWYRHPSSHGYRVNDITSVYDITSCPANNPNSLDFATKDWTAENKFHELKDESIERRQTNVVPRGMSSLRRVSSSRSRSPKIFENFYPTLKKTVTEQSKKDSSCEESERSWLQIFQLQENLTEVSVKK